jgi:DNA-binding IclR family transcriptional regulator
MKDRAVKDIEMALPDMEVGAAPQPQKDRKYITALARGFEILRAFKPGAGPMGNQALSEATGIPKATVSRLTHTLASLGYLRATGDRGRFEPTESILALGYAVLSNMPVIQLASGPMQEIAARYEVSLALASRDRLRMIFTETCNSKALSTLHLEVGARVPMHSTAVGRAFLAGLPEAERTFFFERIAERMPAPEWAAIRERLEDAVRQVATRGFCYVEDEWHQGMRAVGAPVRAAGGRHVMSMLCGAPAFAVSRDLLETELGPRLTHLCRSLDPTQTLTEDGA